MTNPHPMPFPQVFPPAVPSAARLQAMTPGTVPGRRRGSVARRQLAGPPPAVAGGPSGWRVVSDQRPFHFLSLLGHFTYQRRHRQTSPPFAGGMVRGVSDWWSAHPAAERLGANGVSVRAGSGALHRGFDAAAGERAIPAPGPAGSPRRRYRRSKSAAGGFTTWARPPSLISPIFAAGLSEPA